MIPLHFSLILAQPFHDTMPFSSRVGSFGKLIIDAIRAEYIYIYMDSKRVFARRGSWHPRKRSCFEGCCSRIVHRLHEIRSTLINARSDVCRDGGWMAVLFVQRWLFRWEWPSELSATPFKWSSWPRFWPDLVKIGWRVARNLSPLLIHSFDHVW